MGLLITSLKIFTTIWILMGAIGFAVYIKDEISTTKNYYRKNVNEHGTKIFFIFILLLFLIFCMLGIYGYSIAINISKDLSEFNKDKEELVKI